jgi:hypothetical protein
LLNVDIDILRKVGELCAPINIDKETLKLTAEDLRIPKLII